MLAAFQGILLQFQSVFPEDVAVEGGVQLTGGELGAIIGGSEVVESAAAM